MRAEWGLPVQLEWNGIEGGREGQEETREKKGECSLKLILNLKLKPNLAGTP